MTVYLDIIFLENLCINSIILLTVVLISKKEIHIARILLSSTLGSIYAVFVYLSEVQIFSNFLFKILLSVCMVQIAYNPKGIKILLKQLLLFYLTSFTFGGVAFAFIYFVRPENILIQNGVLIGTSAIKLILVGVIVGFIVVIISFKNIKSKISKKDMFCNITIELNNKFKKIKAMIDTGNLLKEPISKSPVIVVEKQELAGIVEEDVLNNTDKIIKGCYEKDLAGYNLKFRVIPFSSLGKENGLLLGIKIDNLYVDYDDQENTINNAIVGIYDKKLSKSNAYTALLGLDIINLCMGQS